MKWENLKNNKCPLCFWDFAKGLKVESNMQPAMLIHSCGFKINEQRYKEISASLVERKLPGENKLSECCGAEMSGGVQCLTCGGPGF
jgi:hypothetical protein